MLPPQPPGLLALPYDLWPLLGLGQRDLCSLAMCCRELRAMAGAALMAQGVRVPQRLCGTLAEARWQPLEALTLHAFPRRYGPLPAAYTYCQIPALVLPRLRRLRLEHCRLPAGFWPQVFAGCPALEDVSVVCDYFLANYAEDVHHTADLVCAGARQLRRLDIEGGWLVMYPTPLPTPFEDARKATWRVYDMAAVPCSALKEYRLANQQAPVPVDAPLERLEINEPQQAPFSAPRMGPLTLASTRHLRWKTSADTMDAGMLSGYSNLDTLEVIVESAYTAARLTKCLGTLTGLPRGLRALRLRLDIWLLRRYPHNIGWGEGLRHLDRLEDLEIDMPFPPSTTEVLLSRWMGAGAGTADGCLRRVRVSFDETAGRGYEEELDRLLVHEEADPGDESVVALREEWARATAPMPADGLMRWLADHPLATVTVVNLPQLTARHPRLAVLAGG